MLYCIVIFISLLSFSSARNAEGNVATLFIEGFVAERLEISTQSSGDSLNIDFSATGKINVGSVQYYSNASTGYKIILKSQNQGRMVHEKGTTNGSVSYRSFFNSTQLKQSDFTSETGVVMLRQSDALAEHGAGELFIQFNNLNKDKLTAGNYRDELTVVISAQYSILRKYGSVWVHCI
jgi:hypothetical protein